MTEVLPELERRNVALVAIGQGTGAEAAEYMRKWELDLTCLGDVSGRAYVEFGMLRGNAWTVMLRSMLTAPIKSLGLTLKADFSGMMLAASDVLRLGGVAVIEAGGALRFIHRAEDPSDNPTNQELIAALDLTLDV
jgi:hypothetical protein